MGNSMLVYELLSLDNRPLTIRIELLSNQIVTRWKKYLRFILSQVGNINWHSVGCCSGDRYRSVDDSIYCLNALKESYALFQSYDIGDFTEDLNNIDLLLKHPENISQTYLNKWHRDFTTLVNRYVSVGYQANPITDPVKLQDAVHKVNQYVHQLEGLTYYKLDRRKQLGNKRQYAFQFTNSNHPDDNKNDVWSYAESLHSDHFDWRVDDYKHSVWLNEDILGKDQFKAWIENDDLTMSDITGNLSMTPSIMLDPYGLFNAIIDNPEFQKESIQSGKTLDRYPIGDVVEITTDNWDDLLGAKVTKITLDGETIWE